MSKILAALARASDGPSPAAAQPAAPVTRSSGWYVTKYYNEGMLDSLKRLAHMRGRITPTHAFIAAAFIRLSVARDADLEKNYVNWLIDAGADELAAHRFLKNQGATVFSAETPWRFKRETVVEKLSVSGDELRLLPAFQPPDLKARMKREAARKERDRRAAGAIERTAYESAAARGRAQILGLAAQDLSNAAIAAATGKTEGAARVALHRARKKAAAAVKAEQHATALRLHAAGCLPGRIGEELGVKERQAIAILKAALKAAEKPAKKPAKKRR